MKIKKQWSTVIFSITGYVIIALISLACLIPFWLILSGSLTGERSIAIDGYRFIPKVFSLDAYIAAFRIPETLLNRRAFTTRKLCTLKELCSMKKLKY